jgi:hypothetical protein
LRTGFSAEQRRNFRHFLLGNRSGPDYLYGQEATLRAANLLREASLISALTIDWARRSSRASRAKGTEHRKGGGLV